MIDNIASADRCGAGTLTEDELALIGRVRDAYRTLTPIPCTGCRYCMPCPNGVNIPRVLELYNDATMYNDDRLVRNAYQWVEEKERADLCTECGQCENLCPQGIAISKWLKRAHALLTGKK